MREWTNVILAGSRDSRGNFSGKKKYSETFRGD